MNYIYRIIRKHSIYWIEIYENQSENKIWLIFLLPKNNIKIIQTKGWCKKMKIIKQELEFEECLKQRLEFICEFSKVTPTFINGSIRKLDKTNLTYIEPHRVIIKNITLLVFNYSNDVYISNLTKKIKLSELEEYLKNIWIVNIWHFFKSWYNIGNKLCIFTRQELDILLRVLWKNYIILQLYCILFCDKRI